MRKQLTFILCGLSVSICASAAMLSPEQALQRLNAPGAQSTRSGKTMPVFSTEQFSTRPAFTANTESGEPALYVFENNARKGYVILSADDAVIPVLGYADSGSFDPEEMPEQMKWWLGEYSRQIEYARANNVRSGDVSPTDDGREQVAPLLKTKWNQTPPYNDLTPIIGSSHAPTGCVATAVAQVMKYWNYPERATGTGTITSPSSDSMVLGEEAFDWENMLDVYVDRQYNDTEAHAVAYLMKAVGYASHMNYGPYSSGTVSYFAGQALINNFGYNPMLRYCTRDYFSAADWEEMIYNEVAAGRPVIYGGQSTSIGHEFVCDGYSSDGYFHFNWGWSGMSDGYFQLTALNPNAIGTGGGEGGGYNYGQDVLVGVQPEKAQLVLPNVVQNGPLTVKASGLTLDLSLDGGSWTNTGLSDISLEIGIALEPIESQTATQYVSISNVKIEAPEVFSTPTGMSMKLHGIPGNLSAKLSRFVDDGRYKVTVVVKNEGSDKWIPVETFPQYYNYCLMEKKGNDLTVTCLPDATVTLVSGEPLTKLYYGCLAKMKIVATNNSDKELTKGFYPELFLNGEEQMIGDGIVVTIPAKTTVTEEFYTTFRLLSGATVPTSRLNYRLAWYDPVNAEYDNKYRGMYVDAEGKEIVSDVTMRVLTGSPELTFDSFTIAGHTPENTVTNLGYVPLYTIPGDEVEFELKVTNGYSFYGYPLNVIIFDDGGREVVRGLFEPPMLLDEGEEGESVSHLTLASLKKDTVYVGFMFYDIDGNLVQCSGCPYIYFQLTDQAGVDDVIGCDDAPVKYYNLQGVEVTDPAKGMMLIKKQGGKISKIVY